MHNDSEQSKRAVTIIAVAGITFVMVAPLFWGTFLLMAMQIYWAPWPALIALTTIIFVASMWIVHNGVIDGVWVFVDVVLAVLCLAFLIGTTRDLPDGVRLGWAYMIYGVSAMQVFRHAFMAMTHALGVTFKKEEVPMQAEPA